MRVFIFDREEGKPIVHVETDQTQETPVHAAKAYKEVKKELEKEDKE